MTQMLCAMDLGCAEGRNESNTSSVGRNERGKEKKRKKNRVQSYNSGYIPNDLIAVEILVSTDSDVNNNQHNALYKATYTIKKINR